MDKSNLLLPEALVRGEDDGLLRLVSLVDDLEEESGFGRLKREITDLVEDEHLRSGQDAEQRVETVLSRWVRDRVTRSWRVRK